MKRLSFLVGLITDDNDFQVEQARAADAAAQRLGVDVEIVYAANDSINQSQQLLNVIQQTPRNILTRSSSSRLAAQLFPMWAALPLPPESPG